jgi:hypothetical protein
MTGKLVFSAHKGWGTRDFHSYEEYKQFVKSGGYDKISVKLVFDLGESEPKGENHEDFIKRAKVIQKLLQLRLDKELE